LQKDAVCLAEHVKREGAARPAHSHVYGGEVRFAIGVDGRIHVLLART